MARAFLGPDVRGIADLVLRHVRFCNVKSFGLNAYRTEVERNRVNSVIQRATYPVISRHRSSMWEPACAETPA